MRSIFQVRRQFGSSSAGRRRAQRGFSMIEVLIALLVLAFGLLGFALLQTLNLRYTQSANYRTQATNLAYDLLDQMRANRLSAGLYAGATFATNTVTGIGCTRPTGTTAIAQNIVRWKCQVAEALGPQARATVTYTGGVATVTLGWAERSSFESGSEFSVETRL
ncbi:MAG: type IV pilus modification protein PilV [Luteimonas sp.]